MFTIYPVRARLIESSEFIEPNGGIAIGTPERFDDSSSGLLFAIISSNSYRLVSKRFFYDVYTIFEDGVAKYTAALIKNYFYNNHFVYAVSTYKERPNPEVYTGFVDASGFIFYSRSENQYIYTETLSEPPYAMLPDSTDYYGVWAYGFGSSLPTEGSPKTGTKIGTANNSGSPTVTIEKECEYLEKQPNSGIGFAGRYSGQIGIKSTDSSKTLNNIDIGFYRFNREDTLLANPGEYIVQSSEMHNGHRSLVSISSSGDLLFKFQYNTSASKFIAGEYHAYGDTGAYWYELSKEPEKGSTFQSSKKYCAETYSVSGGITGTFVKSFRPRYCGRFTYGPENMRRAYDGISFYTSRDAFVYGVTAQQIGAEGVLLVDVGDSWYESRLEPNKNFDTVFFKKTVVMGSDGQKRIETSENDTVVLSYTGYTDCLVDTIIDWSAVYGSVSYSYDTLVEGLSLSNGLIFDGCLWR